jgi:hypothetical protein
MTDAPVDPDVKIEPAATRRPSAPRLKRPSGLVGEPVSIKANILAAIGSFLFLAIAPAILLRFVPLPDEIIAVFVEYVPFELSEILAKAFGTALLFLVIGIGFQLWQSRRGLSCWWPYVLAFPVTGVLVLPDALARGGAISGWIALGAALALAFCFHWLAVRAFGEILD